MISKYVVTGGKQQLLHKLKHFKFPILDYCVESNTNISEILNFQEEYLNTLWFFPNSCHALKFSSVDYRLDKINEIGKVSVMTGNKLFIDAEQNSNHENYLYCADTLCSELNKTHVHVYKTYQMYRKDSIITLKNDLDNFANEGLYHGIKLVRGAYLEEDKMNDVLLPNKEAVDQNYRNAMIMICSHIEENDNVNCVFATHNKNDIDYYNKIKPYYKDTIQHAYLMGMKPNNACENSMVYVPYGPFFQTIPYLIRRLYENKSMLKYLLK